MTTHTVSVGRYNPPAFAVVAAVVAAIAIAILAVADVTFNAGPFASTGSSPQVSAPAAGDMPTPEWLKGYLAPKAPAANDVPTPEWLKGYLEPKAPAGGHVNDGLR